MYFTARALTLFATLLFLCATFTGAAYAEPSVSIIIEKSTYTYCEKLFYTINVTEIDADVAIIHIVDDSGKRSSAIPIPITGLQTPVPALFPFEKNIFSPGTYSIDVTYSGAQASGDFTLVDTADVLCISQTARTFAANWIAGLISDGFLIDAFQKHIDDEVIHIPFKIDGNNIHAIDIPEWVKYLANIWIQDAISDDEFVNAINYLLDHNIIGPRA